MPSPRVRYQTIEIGDLDVHVRTLRDTLQYSDEDGVADRLGISSANWALFGVLWPASRVLARLMLAQNIVGKRILEIGCGIGLSSLVLSLRMADITATDYHPEAEGFLQRNVALNGGRAIPFVRAGWDDADCGLGAFDVIAGSDLLYERGHAASLAGFIDRHARPACEVIIIDPGRGHRARFGQEMSRLGYTRGEPTPGETWSPDEPSRGRILRYAR